MLRVCFCFFHYICVRSGGGGGYLVLCEVRVGTGAAPPHQQVWHHSQTGRQAGLG